MLSGAMREPLAGECRREPEVLSTGRSNANGYDATTTQTTPKPKPPHYCRSPLTTEVGVRRRAYVGGEKLWDREYLAFSRVAVPLTDAGAHRANKKKLEEWLDKRAATCFWRAMAACSQVKTQTKLIEFMSTRNVKGGVSVSEAAALLARAPGPAIPLYFHNSESGEVSLVRKGKEGPAILFVECNAEGEGDAHCLPIYRVKTGAVLKIRNWMSDETEQVGTAPAIEAVQRLEEDARPIEPAFAQLILPVAQVEGICHPIDVARLVEPDESLLRMQRKNLLAIEAQEVERIRRRDAPGEDLPLQGRRADISLAECAEQLWAEPVPAPVPDAPVQEPTEDIRRALSFVRYVRGSGPPPKMAHTVVMSGFRGDGLPSNIVEREYSFGLWDHYLLKKARKSGATSIELRELREDMTGERLRVGTLFYSRIEERNPLDNRRYITGALVHKHVKSITADRQTFQLERLGVTDDLYEVSRLVRAAVEMPECSCVGPLEMLKGIALGIDEIIVKSVYLTEVEVSMTMRAVSALPNDVSKIRTVGALLRTMLPEDEVGLWNDVMLESIAKKDARTDVLMAARQLHAVATAASTARGGRKAFGHK